MNDFENDVVITTEDFNKMMVRNKDIISEFSSKSTMFNGVGNEDFMAIISNAKMFLTKGLDKISGLFSSSLNETKNPIPVFRDINDYITYLERSKGSFDSVYLEALFKTDIPYIAGCKVNFETLVDRLKSLVVDHGKKVKNAVYEADLIVSKALSSDDFRKSSRPYTETQPIKDGKKFNEDIANFNREVIDPVNMVDHKPFSEVFGNVSSLYEAGKILKSIGDMTLFKDLQNIHGEVTSISVKVKSLANQIETGNIECTNECIKHVISCLTVSAEAVTSLAILYYFIGQAAQVFKSTCDIMKSR